MDLDKWAEEYEEYGHEILDRSKVFTWTLTEKDCVFGSYFCYTNKEETVGIWIDRDWGEANVILEGANCLGELYSKLNNEDKALFLEEFEDYKLMGIFE